MKNREYIIQRFRVLYQSKWAIKGKSQQQFADEIKKILPDSGINKTYVSRLVNGVYAPRPHLLQAICTVLGVNASEFDPQSRNDKYRYSVDYAKKVEGDLERRAIEDFKIDLTFFQGLRNIMPDFEEKYPKYSPLHYYGIEDSNHKFYERSVPAKTQKIPDGESLFQITRDGKTIFLTPFDLKTIKLIQGSIAKYASALFEKLTKEFEKAEADANLKQAEMQPDLKSVGVENWYEYILSDEELQKIDKLGIYTEQERKKYNFSDIKNDGSDK